MKTPDCGDTDMWTIDLPDGQTLRINAAGPLVVGRIESRPADNAVKSWGEPGSKVKQRVTERAEAKAAEDKELFMAIAEIISGSISGALIPQCRCPEAYDRVVAYLDEQSRKYGQFELWEDAYVHLKSRESEDETQ